VEDFAALCRAGTPQEVQDAIYAGADVNARDKESGRTPLMYAAAFNGSADVISVLLNAGAKVNAEDKDGWTALMLASEHNDNSDVLSALIDGVLTSTDDFAALEKIFKTGKAKNFLETCATGTPQEVQEAIDAGAYVNAENKDGVKALMLAAQFNGDPDVPFILLRRGADAEAKNKDGFTALMLAAQHNGNPDVLSALIRGGADVEARGEGGVTALMLAAAHNGPDAVSALLFKADLFRPGADANAKDAGGNKALDYAVRNKALENTAALAALRAATR
jgi:ankyrin repeat protein